MTRVQINGASLGRDAELSTVRRLLDDSENGARAVVLEGEPGLGKSTLWTAGVDEARTAG
jgi:DNA replication protein DnaC